MTAGWKLKSGEILSRQVSNDKLWSVFNYVFSGSKKRNTYKFGLIKALLDNLFNMTLQGEDYFISYQMIFEKFAQNYWNLVVKYHLKQMRSDGRSEYSKVESIFRNMVNANPIIATLEFDVIGETERNRMVQEISKECRKNVVGALHQDTEGLLYSFDLKKGGLYISSAAYEFMLKYKEQLEKLNYYSWAKFLEQINDGNVLIGLLDKLELSTPQRTNLSVYREILKKEFEENTCFYCGSKLTKAIHVDHFIPWSYVKDDKMWNFVLSCSRCNEKKNNKIPAEKFLLKIEKRNKKAAQIHNDLVYEDFKEYDDSRMKRLWKYAQLSGMKQFDICVDQCNEKAGVSHGKIPQSKIETPISYEDFSRKDG